MKSRVIKKDEYKRSVGRPIDNPTLLKMLEFMDGDAEAIEFEYDDPEERRLACNCVRAHFKRRFPGGIPIEIHEQGLKMYIMRKG